MPRAHGEHKRDFAARQLAKTMPAPTPTSEIVYILPLCDCGARPYPHPHTGPNAIRYLYETKIPLWMLERKDVFPD